MTITGDTLCAVIQAFPVLLILAQNQKRCLTTPLVYKPPSPTHTPEYYEAYDALIQSLLHKKCPDHNAAYYSYDVTHYSPCHAHESYPSYPHNPTYSHSYPSHPHPTLGYAHSYPSHPHPTPGYTYSYPSHYPSYMGKVYNVSGYGNGHGQVKNVKYKIVVKKNKVVKRRRSGKLRGSNQRSERRYATFFGFPQNLANILPENVKNIPGRISNILYITTPDKQKNQYGQGNEYGQQQYQNGNPNWIPNQQSNLPVNQNDQNGNTFNSGWNQNANSVIPNNQIGNQPSPNWNSNAAEPNWSGNGNRNPNRYDQNQNYQNGNHNNGNQYDSYGRPINNQPSVYSTQPPDTGDDIPNDYVDLNDSNVPSVVTEEIKPEGKNNEQIAVTDKSDNFDDRHGEGEPASTEAVTHLQALTPVDSRDSVSFGVFQDSCTTAEGGTGSCTVIFSCPQYARLLTQARSSPAAVQLLRKVHCGFEGTSPKVCCPSSEIPTSAPVVTTTTTTPSPAQGRESDDVLLKPPVCGISNATSSRVVGGAPARLGDFPWMALLGYKPRRGSDPRWLCGGSLISARHVLTAAHCIHGHEDDLYQVRLGELDLARDDEGATPTDVAIQFKVKHEEYSPQSFTNDIGLLLLARSVEFTSLIRPICIPEDSELRARSFENYTPVIAGWGDTEFRGPAATHLQALQLPVVSNEFCAGAYKQYKAQVIDKRVLCAGYKKGGHDACQGDSGGPLMQPIWMVKEHVTYMYQIGVVSYGRKCAEAGFPGVYTRVTEFVPWLMKNMAETMTL